MKMKQDLNSKQNFQLSFNPNYSLSDSQDQERTKWRNCKQAIYDMDWGVINGKAFKAAALYKVSDTLTKGGKLRPPIGFASPKLLP